jgi:steroid delta-isomerase-like uncharacterized protein
MSKSNVELVTRIYSLFSSGQPEKVLEHAAADVEIEMIAFGQTFRGHDGFRQFMQAFNTSFPDLKIEAASPVSDGDRVVAELVGVGTHKGPLMTPAGPIPPTGNTVHFRVCEVWEMRDGKVAKLRNYQDAGSILRQIGAA